MSESRPARSGCALALGSLLIAAGTLLLLSNLFGLSLSWVWTRGLVWFSTYWPALLIVWGGYKIYQRVAHPDVARVGAGEVVLLVLIALAGLTLHFARRWMDTLPTRISVDEIIESIDPDISFGPAYVFTEEHRFEMPSRLGLVVANGRGAVTVGGWEEPNVKLVLTKRVYRHSEEAAQKAANSIQVRFEAPPDQPARLEIEAASAEPLEAETDLEIWLPRETPLTVSNRRGPVRASGLEAPVTVATTHDSVEVRDIQGGVRIEGRRGPVRVERVSGDVEARNRYGSLTVKDVRGDLVGETADGAILVEGVGGTARLVTRQSRIRATDLGGDLTVEATNAEVFVEKVGANATIETSYRPVFVKGVEGQLSVEARNSEIEAREIKGNLNVTNVYRTVTAADVGGSASVNAQNAAVRLDGVKGPIQVESSYNLVEIRRFQSSVIVEAEHAPLRMSTDHLAGELNLATSYGEVELVLPPEGSFRLEARVRGGQVFSDFSQPDWDSRKSDDVTEVRGTAGAGAVPVRIETSYGDVRIRKATSN